MKRLAICAALFCGACGALVWSPLARGQNGKPAAHAAREAPPLKIAVIDVGAILAEYKKYEDVKEELVTAEKSAFEKSEQLAQQGKELEKKLAKLDRGTPEYLELEQKVQKAAGDYQFFGAVQRKDLKQRKVEAHAKVFNDIAQAVKKFAEKNNYTLVLQINREALAAKSYRYAEAALAQEVLHHSPNDDITDPILAYLNQQYDQASPTATEAPAASNRKSPAPSNRKSPHADPPPQNRKNPKSP